MKKKIDENGNLTAAIPGSFYRYYGKLTPGEAVVIEAIFDTDTANKDNFFMW